MNTRKVFDKRYLNKILNLELQVANIDTDGTVIATDSKLGNVKVGDGLSVTSEGVLSVKKGDGLTTSSGTLKVYTSTSFNFSSGKLSLKPATASLLGGIKVGDTMYVDSNGKLDIASNALSFSSSDFQNSPPDIDAFSTGWTGAGYKILNVSADSLHEYTLLQIETNRFLSPVCTGFLNKEESSTLYKYTYNVYTDPKDAQVYVLYKKVEISS